MGPCRVFSLPLALVMLSFAGCGNQKQSLIHTPDLVKSEGSGESKTSASGAQTSNGTSATTGSTTSTSTTNVSAAFGLADAKKLCVSCHVTGGTGARKWSTADGTEADWITYAERSKASIEQNVMPPSPLDATTKANFIKYLDGLIAKGSATAGTPSAFTASQASAFCGCHTATVQGDRKPLVTLADWNNRSNYSRALLTSEVESGSMPVGRSLTTSEKASMLLFINSLNP